MRIRAGVLIELAVVVLRHHQARFDSQQEGAPAAEVYTCPNPPGQPLRLAVWWKGDTITISDAGDGVAKGL